MRGILTSLRALDVVAQLQPVGVSEIARRLDVPKPTAQRALLALAEAHWIERAPSSTGKWVLTVKALDVARHVGHGSGLRAAALPAMARLVDVTTESAHLAVMDGLDVVVIEEIESTQVVRIHWPVGSRSPAYATANGKAILAALPEDRVKEHLPTLLHPHTKGTHTGHGPLMDDLRSVREGGFATQCGELREDVASIAAAIRGPSGEPAGSVSLFMPAQRFPLGEDMVTVATLVREAADAISRRLNGHG